MLTEIPLTTGKYLRQVTKQEHKRWRRARNRKALQDFSTFLFGLLAIGASVYAVERIHIWLPIVKANLAAWGVPNVI